MEQLEAGERCLEELHTREDKASCRESATCSGTHTELPASPTGEASVRKICKSGIGLNLHYYCHFYSKTTADTIFQQLERQLDTHFASSPQTVTLAGRRVVQIPRRQTAFGDRGLSYTFSGTTVPANPWIPLVSALKDHVETTVGATFNFVLVNRYKDGSDHIGEHRDNERGLEGTAPIASLSFGQARNFVLRHKDARGSRRGGRRGGEGDCKIEPVKLELGHGSLLVMWHPTNNTWYHSLPVRRRALHPRINLTFRRMTVHHTEHRLKDAPR